MNNPHLTPANLLGGRRLPPAWAAARTAFICFTPFPNGFAPYVTETAPERFFLHSPNSEVRLCHYEGIPFLVISEVYGFPVGATTVEELVHHGVRQIIGVGYAGAFNGATMGQPFVATHTMADLPLADHYGVPALAPCGPAGDLEARLAAVLAAHHLTWAGYTVWNGNSLYREYPHIIDFMREQGCDVVNMDTLSLYAVAPVLAREIGEPVHCLYVGTVTDSAQDEAEEWQSDLIEAVERKEAHPHDRLVQFMVEQFLPSLEQAGE
ncbi:MAG: hypothetical protein H6651_09130 [Ardenticatenales bacterium]|nr:hypothetical protein [Ardenticatenales bacterium]